MMDWQPIETLTHGGFVMLAKWYEDDCDGYCGPSGWLWVASGAMMDNDEIWIDAVDDTYPAEGFTAPTHWAPMIEPIK